MAHVVILGGGFGGLAAASELRGILPADDRITLVARDDTFYMGFAKLWDLAGVRPLEGGRVPLSRLAERGVEFVQADISSIDPATRTVETSAGRLEADALLVALGADPAPGHRAIIDSCDTAHDLYDPASLPAIHRALDEVESGTVVVSIIGGPIKCPPAPYEAALIVDELLRERGVRDRVGVAVSTPQPLTIPAAGPDASRFVAGFLAERDVALLVEHAVETVDAGTSTIRFGNGAELEFAALLGVPASAPPPVVRDSPLAGPSGFAMPNRHTLRTEFERVYAVGDCTVIPNAAGQLPKAGVFAAGEAVVAARNIAADLHGTGGATFDGHGYCFLELPGRKVAFVEGDFYAEPRPDVTLTEADDANFARKQAYEADRLADWLGVDIR